MGRIYLRPSLAGPSRAMSIPARIGIADYESRMRKEHYVARATFALCMHGVKGGDGLVPDVSGSPNSAPGAPNEHCSANQSHQLQTPIYEPSC